MSPELSEFSYGYALTSELAGWTALRSAPIFPTQVEEGKISGGYDVMLDFPAEPMFLQFKRADYLNSSLAREIQKYHLNISKPFYRFPITPISKSNQHLSLLTHAQNGNGVYYVAPRFHRISELNDAYLSQNVANDSVFVDPCDIGPINDDHQHHVSYDRRRIFICSEPRAIKTTSSHELRERFARKLKEDTRPLRSRLEDWDEAIDRTVKEADLLGRKIRRESELRREQERQLQDDDQYRLPVSEFKMPRMTVEAIQRSVEIGDPSSPLNDFDIQTAKDSDPDQSRLRKLSEKAMTELGAQLFIVQNRKD